MIQVRKKTIRKARTINLETAINGFFQKWKNTFQKKYRLLLDKIQKQLSVDEIQQALITGQLSPGALEKVRKVISDFCNSNMPELTSSAADKIYQDLKKRFPDFSIEEYGKPEFNQAVADGFSEQLYQTQEKAIKEAVKYTNSNVRIDSLPKHEISQVIKRGAGLHSVALKSCLNYYAGQIENGNTKANARKNTNRYIERKYKERSKVLAQDSILNNYRQTEYQAIGDGISQGIFNDVVKVWSSSEDARVCDICKELDGQVAGYNESFQTEDGRIFDGLSGAHTACRCVIQYIDRELYELGIY